RGVQLVPRRVPGPHRQRAAHRRQAGVGCHHPGRRRRPRGGKALRPEECGAGRRPRLVRRPARRGAEDKRGVVEIGRPTRIGLYGLFGIDNWGLDASLEAMIGSLRRLRPEAELVCICADPEKIERKFQISARWIRARAPRAASFHRLDRVLLRVPRVVTLPAQTLAELRRLDVILVPGTGILEDLGDKPWRDPLSLFLWCLGARAMGVEVRFVCVGAGPMRNPLNRWLLKSAARMATSRSYRDEYARDFLRGIGVNVSQDTVAADIVFGLPRPSSTAAPVAGGALTVGVGAMLYRGWSDDDQR